MLAQRQTTRGPFLRTFPHFTLFYVLFYFIFPSPFIPLYLPPPPPTRLPLFSGMNSLTPHSSATDANLSLPVRPTAALRRAFPVAEFLCPEGSQSLSLVQPVTLLDTAHAPFQPSFCPAQPPGQARRGNKALRTRLQAAPAPPSPLTGNLRPVFWNLHPHKTENQADK